MCAAAAEGMSRQENACMCCGQLVSMHWQGVPATGAPDWRQRDGEPPEEKCRQVWLQPCDAGYNEHAAHEPAASLLSK